ncbi:MAG: prolyl oligopeptidase family serine peptidase [Lachnospiraceae bacterium]|nr:prolyl oligopeptidase family serine peptidase [Lachnospiraceae bacterium]
MKKKITLKTNGSPQKISYRSSKKSVVNVNKKGRLTAKKTGTAKVTISWQQKDGKRKKEWFKVHVVKKRRDTAVSEDKADAQSAEKIGTVTPGSKYYKGFLLDNVLTTKTGEKIHYNLYVPKSYDGKKKVPLFITLPGWEGLYFQGVGENLKWEDFGFEAQKYHENMIIAAPQLDDWGSTSAEQTITLTKYFLAAYEVNEKKVYINGYSGGGETLSLVLEKEPKLYTAALHVSSQWDGTDYKRMIRERTPLYFAIGEKDSYYGSEPVKSAYRKLKKLYQETGLSEKEIEEVLILDIKEQAYFDARGVKDQHAGGGTFAKDQEIMGWLFGH